jgi:AraC-like DNA-binding protein
MINIRATKAKELLKYSDQTILEISHLVGIDNVSYFINLFKDRTGLTPLSFRKSWQVPK